MSTTARATALAAPSESGGSTAANGYADLFADYIERSVAASLALIRTIETKLPEVERVQACHILDYGLRGTKRSTVVYELALAMASHMERSGHWEIWAQLLMRLINLAHQTGEDGYEISLTALLARLYQRWNRPQELVQSYRRVIRLARQRGNRYELARACSNLGYFYAYGQHPWRATILCRRALAIFEDLQSDHGQAHTHNHLGILATRQGEWTQAEEHLLTACALWRANHDQFGLMRGLGNLSFLYNESGNDAKGVAQAQQALALAETVGEEPLIANFAANISLGKLKLGDVETATHFAAMAEALYTKYGDRLGSAQIAHTKALLAIHHRQYSEAEALIALALRELVEPYFRLQVRLTKVELEIHLQNYGVAAHELDQLQALANTTFRGQMLSAFRDKLTESRHRLAVASCTNGVPQSRLNGHEVQANQA